MQYGGYYWQSLDQVLAPIIERHRQQLEAAEQARLRRERTQLLDDRWARILTSRSKVDLCVLF